MKQHTLQGERRTAFVWEEDKVDSNWNRSQPDFAQSNMNEQLTRDQFYCHSEKPSVRHRLASTDSETEIYFIQSTVYSIWSISQIHQGKPPKITLEYFITAFD